jgi:hypothetical protein
MRVPDSRAHTGTVQGERLQEQARRVASRFNATAKDHGGRLDDLERDYRGLLPYVMGNVDRVLTADEAAYAMIEVTGAHTGIRLITYPAITDNEDARVVWVTNATTGGFDVYVMPAGGALYCVVPAGSSKAVRLSAAGAKLLT